MALLQRIYNSIKKISLYSTLNAVDFYKKLGFRKIKDIKLKLKTVFNNLIEMEKFLR